MSELSNGTSKTTSQRFFLLALGAVFIVTAAGLAGLFFLKNSDSRQESAVGTPSITPTTSLAVYEPPIEDQIRKSIEDIILAYSVGNVAVLKNETCGGLKEQFALVSDQSLREETAKAFEERGGGFLLTSKPTIIKGSQAWVKSTLRYDKLLKENGESQTVLATFTMDNSDGTWRVCGIKAE